MKTSDKIKSDDESFERSAKALKIKKNKEIVEE